MNVYHVKTFRDDKIYVVIAKNIIKVVELMEKYAKKSYWYSYDIKEIVLHEKVNMVQK